MVQFPATEMWRNPNVFKWILPCSVTEELRWAVLPIQWLKKHFVKIYCKIIANLGDQTLFWKAMHPCILLYFFWKQISEHIWVYNEYPSVHHFISFKLIPQFTNKKTKTNKKQNRNSYVLIWYRECLCCDIGTVSSAVDHNQWLVCTYKKSLIVNKVPS